MKSKIISFRVEREKYDELLQKVGVLGFPNMRSLLRKMVDDIVKEEVETKPVKKVKYPDNTRCKHLYLVFLNQTPESEGGKVPKDKLYDVQMKASIAQKKAFKIRVEMLKAQGFLVERGEDLIVVKKWS